MLITLVVFYINYAQSFKFIAQNSEFDRDPWSLAALSRSGVCIPKDVGLFGRFKAIYHCNYTRDNVTKTGDEWERHLLKTKGGYKIEDVPGKPYQRIIFGPPLDTSEMVLKGGDPYLTLNLWIPGIKAEDIKVILDYSLDSASAVKKFKGLNNAISCDSMCNEQDYKYYSAALDINLDSPENDDATPRVDLFDEYDGSYCQINEKSNMFTYKTGGDSKLKPPLITINCPKNTIVSQWEFSVFRSRKDSKRDSPKSTRLQRSYRPFTHIDLRNISCNYTDCIFQFHAPLIHIPPPPSHRKIHLLLVKTDLPLFPVRSYALEQVHGWIYNWRKFNCYTKQIAEETYNLDDPIEPDFGDELSKREISKFIRAVDKES